MRVVLANIGSAGDIQPFMALAVELCRHGHQAALASSPEAAPWAERHGLRFYPLGPDLRDVQIDVNKFLASAPKAEDRVEQLRSLFEPIISGLPEVINDLQAACRDADVLVGGADHAPARIVHEITGIPFASAQLDHCDYRPSPEFERMVISLLSPLLIELGLAPLDELRADHRYSSQLAMVATSRYLYTRSHDWPPHYHLTGYFFLEEEGWQPDPALLDFINAGDPPVVITFGSMAYEDQAKVSELVREAAQLGGYRTIIQQGWGELARGPLPPNIHAIDFVPYAWLFQRASCVVHHGGSGTTAWAFRAGVPSVIVPHFGDQFLWASEAYKLGCAVAPLPYAELTAERLAVAIAMTISNEQYGRKADELGKKIRSEGGVEKARQLIEQMV